MDGDADCIFFGAFAAALINFPIWRAGAVHLFSSTSLRGANNASSSFSVTTSALPKSSSSSSSRTLTNQPYRGVVGSVLAMTWSRGGIFFASQLGYRKMREAGFGRLESSVAPSFLSSSLIQFLNTPLIMGTLAMQNPQYQGNNSVLSCLANTYQKTGFASLFAGATSVMLRSVPKYVAIISIDNYLDEALTGEAKFCKGSLAGIGAVLLTNPFDSLHAEYLKAEKLSLVSVIKREGLSLLSKGLAPNMIAVVLPTTVTILVSDILKTWKYSEYADL